MKVNGYKICPQADLKNANLSGFKLHGADLRGANLKDANLCETDLRWASLNEASLNGANLRGANLEGARLENADLGGADLAGTNLRRAELFKANLKDLTLKRTCLVRANLFKADLRGVNLAGADLRGVNFGRADLEGADLRGSFLKGSSFEGANLDLAKLPPFQIPQEGELIVWKSCRGGVLVKLRVPAGARRTASIVGRKCRAEFAEVLVVYKVVSGLRPVVSSSWDANVYYQEGGVVYPDCYDPDPRVECAGGIHFYLTRQEAIDHHGSFNLGQATHASIVGSRAHVKAGGHGFIRIG